MDSAPWHADVITPALLRHARTTYGAAIRGALAEAGFHDIPRNGLYVIGGLARGAGDAPLGQLVRELRITKQAAGQLVDALVLRGYLQRTPDPADRRRLNLTLTERGHAAASVLDAARVRIDAELEARIGADGVEELRRGLAALVDIGAEAAAARPEGQEPRHAGGRLHELDPVVAEALHEARARLKQALYEQHGGSIEQARRITAALTRATAEILGSDA